MVYTFKPQGVCSTSMTVDIDDNNIIQSMQAEGGCNGNLQAVGRLLTGMSVEAAIVQLKGIKCGWRSTSCADQLAVNLETYLNQ